MQFIHAREWLDNNQCVRVMRDTQCNVQLMDDMNSTAFQRGAAYRYQGGFYKRFPAVLMPPHPGHWNVTLDLAGGSAHIHYSITVINGKDGIALTCHTPGRVYPSRPAFSTRAGHNRLSRNS